MTRKDREQSWLAKLMFWKADEKDKPEQYRIKVIEAAPASVVSVQDPKGEPTARRTAKRSSRCSRTSSSNDHRGHGRECRRLPVHPARTPDGRLMRFASIGSGSEGNGLVVEAGATRILIDCGFGVRDAAGRLARIGVAPEMLSAVIVTHEHADHVGGVPAFAARYHIPVGSPSARSASSRAFRRHGPRLRIRQSRPFRDRRSRSPALSGAARCARARPVS